MAQVGIVQSKATGESLILMWRAGRTAKKETVGSVWVPTSKDGWSQGTQLLADTLAEVRAAERELRARTYVQLRLPKED